MSDAISEGYKLNRPGRITHVNGQSLREWQEILKDLRRDGYQFVDPFRIGEVFGAFEELIERYEREHATR